MGGEEEEDLVLFLFPCDLEPLDDVREWERGGEEMGILHIS